MEWLWLLLGGVGLGLLWLLIIGMDKLTLRLKAHDEARRIATKRIAERTAQAEADLMEKQIAKANAIDFIQNVDLNKDPNAEATLQEAIDTLDSKDLVHAVAKRLFGVSSDTKEITATQSAFDQTPVRKVVAKAEGVMPVKVKPAGKSALSKSEQKMLKKIKQGY